ncbi:MAG: nucleotidyltransferase domain-containing protein [Methanosarcinales archaeon]
MDKKEIAKQFAKEVSKKFRDHIISIILFGSVAKGEDNKYSDIDILVLSKNPYLIRKEFSKIIVDFLEKYGELIESLILEEKDLTRNMELGMPIIDDIKKSEVVLWGKSII